MKFTIVAPAGFATDPASVVRAEALLTRFGHRVHVDRSARTRWQRFSAPDDERLAAIARAASDDSDVVVMLRLQNVRMRGALLPSDAEYFKHYGLTTEKLALAKPDVIVMHPGPMNRGVEIDSAVADGDHAVILPQVTFGIAVRMAVMSILAGN